MLELAAIVITRVGYQIRVGRISGRQSWLSKVVIAESAGQRWPSQELAIGVIALVDRHSWSPKVVISG